jgi:hypothetical protein
LKQEAKPLTTLNIKASWRHEKRDLEGRGVEAGRIMRDIETDIVRERHRDRQSERKRHRERERETGR